MTPVSEGNLPENEGSRHRGPVSSLSGFKLEKVVFEVKYPHAWLLWDRAGTIWEAVRRKWHDFDLKPLLAEPSRCAFRMGTDFDLSVELEATRLVSYFPELSMERPSEIARELIELVSKVLELSAFSRVGLRLLFFQEFPDRVSATTELLKTELIHLHEGRHFGSDGDPVSSECSVSWEMKARGIRVLVGYQHRQFKMEAPLELTALSPQDFSYHGLVFDIDFYTTTSIDVGQLGVQDWISQNVHVLRRDIDSFLWGG